MHLKIVKKTRTKTEQFFKYVLIPAAAETFAQKRRTENKSLILHFHKNRSASMNFMRPMPKGGASGSTVSPPPPPPAIRVRI